MENHFVGEISCEGIKDSRSVRKFIAKRFEKRIHAENLILASQSELPRCRFTLRREGEGHRFSCTLELTWQGRRWSATIDAAGLHQSVIQCLDLVFRQLVPPTHRRAQAPQFSMQLAPSAV